jgi:homoserine O-succinyltransferase/O-acetyltransferase
MLQMMDGDRVPAHWEGRNNRRATGFPSTNSKVGQPIQIALINNMPDPALEDTESQFFELLEVAADDLPVRVKLYSLPGIPRGERGNAHLRNFYADFGCLWNTRCDALIVTGTEPRRPELREEPYWRTLVEVLEWAEQNTASTVLSCLAAHAGVLQCDGIERRPLADKQFGVFDEQRVCSHELTHQAPDVMRFPHSRWNELPEKALVSSGYSVLTRSVDAGVNLFVKKRKNSLFVHFQGHPEYKSGTLLKEYCRDIKRFLRGERKNYPLMPQGYFDLPTAKALAEFQRRALCNPREELMSEFPQINIAEQQESAWQSPATRVYRNWLQYLAAKKARSSMFALRARAGLAQFD